MKSFYLFSLLSFVLLASSCSKKDYYYPPDEYDWMRSHEKGTVAYVDSYTGNYIVSTYNGYAVIENFDGIYPHKYDDAYAHFSNPGTQTIYNYHGNYFSTGRVVDSWLSWQDALYLLDELSY